MRLGPADKKKQKQKQKQKHSHLLLESRPQELHTQRVREKTQGAWQTQPAAGREVHRLAQVECRRERKATYGRHF